MKAFKTELDPNNVQTTAFRQHSGAGRWAYNWGLERIKEAIALALEDMGANEPPQLEFVGIQRVTVLA